MSNFTFLATEWPDLLQKARLAEQRARTEPVSSLHYARLLLEQVVHEMYRLEYLEFPYNTTLSSLMKEPDFARLLPGNLSRDLVIVRRNGNNASHHGRRVTAADAVISLRYLFPFVKWFAGKYSEAEPVLPGAFNEDYLPSEGKERRMRAQLEEAIAAGLALEKEFAQLKKEREELVEQARESKAAQDQLDQKIAVQRAAVAKRKEARTVVVAEEFTEAETRKHLIDGALAEAGWDLLRPGHETEYKVSGMPVSRSSKNGNGYVDYVLWGDDGLPLALIEAKRTKADPDRGKLQASLYADALEKEFGRRPVIFYTNGYDTYLFDDVFYSVPRKVSGFLTKDELTWRIQQRQDRNDIRRIGPKAEIAGRTYQQEAIRRIAENLVTTAISYGGAAVNHSEAATFNEVLPPTTTAPLRGNRRSALLVMATGSGKTRTAAALVDILLNNGWARRVLFLADRNALVTQAKDSFSEHLPEVSTIDLTKEKEDSNTRVVFSTYPTMLNRIDASYRSDDDTQGPLYTVGHFDLIIVDEAHRSVYNRYRAIFDYFDSLVVALTATPKSAIDHNTYELFGCSDEDPTFEYTLDTAVEEKFLVNYQNIDVSTRFIREGIKYADLNDREREQYEEKFRDEVTGEIPDEISAGAINKWLFNKDTVHQVLDRLMTDGLKIAGGDTLGRTIVFAVNKKHAKFITECFTERYPELPAGFVQAVYNDISHVDTTIKSFCNKHVENQPQVAVSVDMMDTGVDAPRVLNLVFFKVVRSYAKFWQMIGRGTRLCPDVYGPKRAKESFLIFDVCQNFDFFAINRHGKSSSATLALTTKVFAARLRLAELLFATGKLENATYGSELLNLLHRQVTDLRSEDQQQRFRVRQARQYLDRFADRGRWNTLGSGDRNDLIRHVAPLILPEGKEESARRFDLLIINLQIADLLGAVSDQEKCRERMIDLATALSRKFGVPEVRKSAEMIEALQQPDFYPELAPQDLDRIRIELRDLLLYLKGEGQESVYIDFADDGIVGTVSSPVASGGSEIYRRRVEAYLRENSHHLIIRKLRNNQPITSAEMDGLNDLLYRNGPLKSQQKFAAAYPGRPLTTFVRTLLGMEESAARAAFSDFVREGDFNANQITFINNIVNYLTQNGVIDPDLLFESPFTDLHDQGVLGVFDDAGAHKLVSILRAVNGKVG